LECALEKDDAMGFMAESSYTVLEKRGSERSITSKAGLGLEPLRTRRYPSRKDYIKIMLRNFASVSWWAVSQLCDETEVTKLSATSEPAVPAGVDTEHPVDVGLVSCFALVFHFISCLAIHGLEVRKTTRLILPLSG
jgi:hypothetical protein